MASDTSNAHPLSTHDHEEADAPAACPRTAFISGPIEVSYAYWERYYQPRVNEAIAAGHKFVIGPIEGIDTLALEYLISQRIPNSRINVYMGAFEINSPKRALIEATLGKPVVEALIDGEKVFMSRERDAVMTANSDYDILRYRTEKEQQILYKTGWMARVSNTECNERRRKGAAMYGYIAHVDRGDADEKEEKGKHSKWLDFLPTRKRDEDPVKTCDGTCDGHRDTVTEGFKNGEVFGQGSDGFR